MEDPHHESIGDESSVTIDPVLAQGPFAFQLPLFVLVSRDDIELLASQDGEWLRVLRGLDWKALRGVAAQYYQALFEFNLAAAAKRPGPPNTESEDEATQRLIHERPTGGNTGAPIIHHPPPLVPVVPTVVRPESIEPGVVPIRIAGRPPKCFFSLLKAFLGVHLMGKAASADEVHHHLLLSPPFVRACGFTLPDPAVGYRQSDIPSPRKLQQFEQIMADRGLWSQIRIQTIQENIQREVIELEDEDLVLDTTHYVAYSEMQVHTVEPGADPVRAVHESTPTVAPTAPIPRRRRKAIRKVQQKAARRAHQAARKKAKNEWCERRDAARQKRRSKQPRRKAKPSYTVPAAREEACAKESSAQRKSQSKTVKNCRCADRATCPHPWRQSDPGAGTVVKGTKTGKKKYWAHKAAVLSTTSGIPLDASAMTDAATHDGQPVVPHLEMFFNTYPDLQDVFGNLLSDTAYDDDETKQTVEDRFGLIMKTFVNPRSIRTRTKDLGRGMKRLSPAGTLTCQADREMTYKGASFARERFIYDPPRLTTGEAACLTCPFVGICCRRDNTEGRQVELPFDFLPHINPADPPMSKRFKALMRRRTAVERAIKRIKLDFGDDHLTRRGTSAFQAHLDRSLIALHLMLRLG
ncbi:MAG: transposase [Candidatus Riflebacteria bacterium]|nr:transposase [Candidatus Riflebacteria bacterium]